MIVIIIVIISCFFSGVAFMNSTKEFMDKIIEKKTEDFVTSDQKINQFWINQIKKYESQYTKPKIKEKDE